MAWLGDTLVLAHTAGEELRTDLDTRKASVLGRRRAANRSEQGSRALGLRTCRAAKNRKPGSGCSRRRGWLRFVVDLRLQMTAFHGHTLGCVDQEAPS